jgi:hypothetical protein
MPEGPVAAVDAFGRSDSDAILSQAAILLCMGTQLRGEGIPIPGVRVQEMLPATLPERLPAEDLAKLGLPSLPPAPGRIDAKRVRGGFASRYSLREDAMLARIVGESITSKVIPDLAQRHFLNPSPVTAATAMLLALSPQTT